MNSIINNIKSRRSIRKYSSKKISDKLVKEIIEAGRYAPSSHNSQPWRFVVLSNKKAVKQLAGGIKSWFRKITILGNLVGLFNKRVREALKVVKKRARSDKDLFLYDAPLVVLICSKKSTFYFKDCGCAAQNMMLAARSLGIGSCWIGFSDIAFHESKTLRKQVGVPKGTHVIATIVFGYPESFPNSGLPRKEEAKVVNWVK